MSEKVNTSEVKDFLEALGLEVKWTGEHFLLISLVL